MHNLLRRIAWFFALAGGGVASLVALMVVASIAGRALWSAPIPGDVELTQFGIALTISLCLPWCQLHGANIIVDFFTQRLPQRATRALDGIGAILLALMCALLSLRTAAGAVAVSEAGETTMILGLPMGWNYLMLAPGLALTTLVALWQAQRLLRGQDASMGSIDGARP
ncbi:TRAP transporter small permease [Sphaerotilus mobilis]|uniref:TRAP transporter small permease protein n=1 Tax=Sphaerotilus mobilis TaxID=47994 RepID=A0A4Q7LWL4_9BURK|nr:TRAP transporter small permease [Sphaerotilus mobilis]RZS58498.1 TRAP-type C4-dicarboxylate transport system permease small subunit [Sphaerotilus mobilis]